MELISCPEKSVAAKQSMDGMILEYGTKWLCQNVGNKLAIHAA